MGGVHDVEDVVLPCVDRSLLDDGKLNEEVRIVEWYIDDTSGWKLVREVDWVVSTDIVGSTVIVEIAGSLDIDRDRAVFVRQVYQQ